MTVVAVESVVVTIAGEGRWPLLRMLEMRNLLSDGMSGSLLSC